MAQEPDLDPGHLRLGHLKGLQAGHAVDYRKETELHGNEEFLEQNWQQRFDEVDELVKAIEAGDRIYKLEDLERTMEQIRRGDAQVDLVDVKGKKCAAANLILGDYETEKRHRGKLMRGPLYSQTGFDFRRRWARCSRTTEFTDKLVPWDFMVRLCLSWQGKDIRDHIPEEVQKECFAKTEQQFKGSNQYNGLLEEFKSERRKGSFDARFKIKKVVCFALGSPVSLEDGLPFEPAIQCQHVLALALMEVFDADVCYTQEPAYSNTDKNIMQQKGMKVVQDPEGFKEVDDNSLVFFMNTNTNLWAIMADNCRPAIIICYPKIPDEQLPAYDREILSTVTAIDDHDEYGIWMDENDPTRQYEKRTRYMAHKEYDEVTLTNTSGGIFPDLLTDRGLAMYVRKPETQWNPNLWRKKDWWEDFTK